MVTLWFSSDPHSDHANIIRFSNRPFVDVREMQAQLLEYHNMFVKPEDHWYSLGDLWMGRGGASGWQAREFITYYKKYNGHKRLLLGNHDHLPTKVYLEAGFEKIYATWRGIDNILLSHIPIHPSSMGSARANVHGHTHCQESYAPVIRIDKETKRITYKPYVNICVEQTNYRPITLEEINERIDKAKGEYEATQAGVEVK